jgi:hypothetical protein
MVTGAIVGMLAGIAVGIYQAKVRGYTMSDGRFWFLLGGDMIAGAVVGALIAYAFIQFSIGMTIGAGAGTGGAGLTINWLLNNALDSGKFHLIELSSCELEFTAPFEVGVFEQEYLEGSVGG